MAPPNPFADEPLPANVVRLQSAADPLDPYAAPPSVSEYRAAVEPGVGLWRDGERLVVHQEATFPARCIFTNEATDFTRRQSITWAYLNDLFGHRVKLNYGLSQPSRRRMFWKVSVALLVACVATGAFSVVTFIAIELPPHSGELAEWSLFPLVCIVGGALKVAWDARHPLHFVKAQKSHVWLGGAGRPFLDSLAHWPGGR